MVIRVSPRDAKVAEQRRAIAVMRRERLRAHNLHDDELEPFLAHVSSGLTPEDASAAIHAARET